MSRDFSRRRLLATSACIALGGTAATSAPAVAATERTISHDSNADRVGAGVREETHTIDQLYESAVAEGGELVIYQGGDVDSQAVGVRTAWASAFPKVRLRVVVDYSKFHDVRIDNQLATKTLVPDVVQLQTLQDFTRWKQQGELLHYKPAGFSEVYGEFKDPDGAWTALMVLAFSFMYDAQAVGTTAPRTPEDLISPCWRNAIASSYPHDDDAALYLYSLYQRTYGWDWVAAFASQQPQFARGSNSPALTVAEGRKSIGVGGSGSAVATSATLKWVLPDTAPFMAWGQRAAILQRAAHPAAARLYMNWQLSEARQKAASNAWSVREDITPNSALKPVWEYPNAYIEGFPRFMEDRAAVERLKQTFALYFGEVRGEPSPGSLGLRPGR